MKTQTFISSYHSHPRNWKPGEDPTPWFDPVRILIEQNTEEIEFARKNGFCADIEEWDENGNGPLGSPVHYPECHTISGIKQRFSFEIDWEGVFRYGLVTVVSFEESLAPVLPP